MQLTRHEVTAIRTALYAERRAGALAESRMAELEDWLSHPADELVHKLSNAAWNLTLAKGLYLDEHETALAEATIKEAIQGAQAAIETHHAAYEVRWRERQRRKGINP